MSLVKLSLTKESSHHKDQDEKQNYNYNLLVAKRGVYPIQSPMNFPIDDPGIILFETPRLNGVSPLEAFTGLPTCE